MANLDFNGRRFGHVCRSCERDLLTYPMNCNRVADFRRGKCWLVNLDHLAQCQARKFELLSCRLCQNCRLQIRRADVGACFNNRRYSRICYKTSISATFSASANQSPHPARNAAPGQCRYHGKPDQQSLITRCVMHVWHQTSADQYRLQICAWQNAQNWNRPSLQNVVNLFACAGFGGLWQWQASLFYSLNN